MTEATALPAEDRARDRIDLAGAGGCSSKDTMRDAAKKAGKTEILDQYAADYPVGPHDQPQSMCPAFGSLRVGLRMRRTAMILSGSACCVYGLTFTSHFYGARRTVGYVPFNSESLVTGKRDTYVLRVKGDSMIDEQIRDGDFVVVEDRKTADNGEMVIALLRGTDVTLKTFFREPAGRIRLQPANPAMQPIMVDPDAVQVQGVVVGVMRKY